MSLTEKFIYYYFIHQDKTEQHISFTIINLLNKTHSIKGIAPHIFSACHYCFNALLVITEKVRMNLYFVLSNLILPHNLCDTDNFVSIME